MAFSVSPLAPKQFPELPEIAGVRVSAVDAGIRYKNRPDTLLAEFSQGTAVAGVVTKSLTRSASVDWCKANLKNGARGLVVNAGNANAFTGKLGEKAVFETAEAAAHLLGCAPEEIFISSTGVIGERLPVEKILAKLPDAKKTLSPSSWQDAARAIMTTDTFAKLATRTVEIDGVKVHINGIAKGSGMIAPNMATMLAYVFTDATIPAGILQEMLSEGCDKSFNSITVDGDTSTSDTLLMFATGKASHAPVHSIKDAHLQPFREALESLLIELAQLIIRDGEGATRFVTIRVTGAESYHAARAIGLSVGNSPLVKTALAAGDANWGRIVAAIGKSGQRADRDALTVSIGGVLIASHGQPHPDYHESKIADYMKGTDIVIEADVGIGQSEATVWTCDLTHQYIDINANYRT